MGRLLTIAPCPVCNYYVEGPLHFGGSSRSGLFIHYRYVLASCRDCRNIVSVLVKTPDYDMPHVLKSAQDDLETLQGRAAQGDVFAVRLLPLHRAALNSDPDAIAEFAGADVERCTVCSSTNLELFTHLGGDEGERFDESIAWVQCPRCEEGKLLIRTNGYWDDIDQVE